jgi:TonB family protein
MHEAVSDILIDRAREAGGLSRMVVVSAAAHAIALVLVVLLPRGWLAASTEPERPMMTISLSGTAGPDVSGTTPIAGRAVQAVAPPEVRPADTPPARATPEMVEPAERPAPKPKPVEKPAEKSAARKPTTGKEVAEGAARVNTGGAQVPFGGLASGGAATGGQAYTDYANFCCPSYLDTMVQIIRRNWNQRQGATGMVLMKFTILRDGRVTNIEHEKPSGVYLLDIESQRALAKTRLPPLPREFPEDSLTVHLYFQYQR